MAVDTATFVNQFDVAKPTGGDPKSEGDDNFRHIKTVMKATFPNVSGAVTATHTEINRLVGLTSAAAGVTSPTLASPVLTGTPIAPTAAGGTNTTQIATTQFVVSAGLSSSLPGQSGNAGKFVTTDGTSASWLGLQDLAAGAVGTYAFALNFSGPATISAGSSTSGSNLRAASVSAIPSLVSSGAGLTGTWRAMTECLLNQATLFQRTA